MTWTLRQTSYEKINGWSTDDHLDALEAFARQTLRSAGKPYNTGSIGLDPNLLDGLSDQASSTYARKNPRKFFENNFLPFRIAHCTDERGQVTGFYEPVVSASLTRTDIFDVPILRRPQDLIAVNGDNRPPGFDPSYRFGKIGNDGKLEKYPDRAAINHGALDGRSLAIAYLSDPVEAFFIHIQGAARLQLNKGSSLRITYDGKSGHPFTAIGKILVDEGEIARDKVSMQSIKTWLREHPVEATTLMERNRSYIFFREAEVREDTLGPIAAAKVPLTKDRSLAVDRNIHTFGTPVFVNADCVDNKPFCKLMVAQETGSAIIGPARGDIFFGSGEQAGERAGAINSSCDFTILVPKCANFDSTKAVVE